MAYLDPTITRISDTLLLSDLMVCDSVVRYGFRNRFSDNLAQNMQEGRYLGAKLDQIQTVLGPFGVCYGFISPELSQKIVTYQDPNKPSYHRWDIGAAADIRFPRWIEHSSPIEAAFQIDQAFDYSRMITYSESEWLCLATSLAEKGRKSRKAFYENRYVGRREPARTTYSTNQATRDEQIASHSLEHDWRGTGYPQYHGGGRLQFEHQPVSAYTTMLDFLYDRDLVHQGVKNLPPLTKRHDMAKWKECASMAGAVYDRIATTHNTRFSITRAYNRTIRSQDWTRFFTLEIVVPVFEDVYAVAHLVEGMDEVEAVSLSSHAEPRILIAGARI